MSPFFNSGTGVKPKDRGIYRIMGGQYSAGRMVYYNQETDKYLKCRKDEINWYVCDSKDCSSFSLMSATGANSMNPAEIEAANSNSRYGYHRHLWGYWINEDFQDQRQ